MPLQFRDSDNVTKTVATEPYVNSRMPTGVVTMYGGATAPTGWLLCQGQAVSRTTYAALFAAIGTNFGTGDGSTTFNLPDMREVAPVGAGTFAAVTGSKHTAQAAADSFTLGQFKDDQFQGHTHRITNSSGAGGQATTLCGAAQNITLTVGYPYTDGTNGTPRTGTVTRGKRLGINFIIKT